MSERPQEIAGLPPQVDVRGMQVLDLPTPQGPMKVMQIELVLVLPFSADGANAVADALRTSGLVIANAGDVPKAPPA